MKSSERGPLVAQLSAVVVAGIAALVIAAVRPGLADRYHGLSTQSDVYTLPAPEQSVVASLGFRSAMADLIYAHVLVSYGLHFQERRRFEFVGNYLDTINTLDPRFRAPYRFADTLLTLQPEPTRWQDVVKAREILERGMKEFPTDGELWTTAGQFLAYLAPAHTKDLAVKKAWRLEGARRLAHACELLGDNENLPYHCITAAGIFTKAGQREASLHFLERVLAVSDDESIRKLALGYLQRELGEQERERIERRFQRFHDAWGKDLPFARKDTLLVIGPAFDPSACAGLDASADPKCASTWRAWGKDQR